MKDNILKEQHSKKPAKALRNYIKLVSDIILIILAIIIILLVIVWLVSFCGLGLIYYFFKTEQYLYALLIIILDMILIRSYIKLKP